MSAAPHRPLAAPQLCTGPPTRCCPKKESTPPVGRSRPTPTTQRSTDSWRCWPRYGKYVRVMGALLSAIRFHRLTRRRCAGKGGRCSGSGRSNWRRGKETEAGGRCGGTIVVTGGQLEQIWESRNLSLRKDDPALSSALCVRCCCHSTVCYSPWSRWNGNFSIFQIREM